MRSAQLQAYCESL